MRKLLGHWAFGLFLLVTGVVGGWFLTQLGYDRIQQLRQLERVPISKAGTVLPGEVAISARARTHEDTVISYYTKTPSLYYRYTHKVKTRDADGNVHWKTVDTREQSADFWLVDDMGKVLIVTRGTRKAIDWSVKESFERTIGDDRYTEWRIVDGQRLFVFAMAVADADQLTLRFDRPGFYVPIVANYSQDHVQESLGVVALFALWGGLATLSLAVLGGAFLLKVHRLLAYLCALTFVIAFALCHLSLTMMHEDLANGLSRYHQQLEAAEKQTVQLLEANGLRWNGWEGAGSFSSNAYARMPEEQRTRLREYRVNVELSRLRLARQLDAKPERWLRERWGFEMPLPFSDLPAEDEAEVQARYDASVNTRLAGFGPKLAVLVGAVLAVAFTFFGYRQVKLKRLIENIPSSPTIAVSCGLAETSGRVVLSEGTEPLDSPYTHSACAWFFYHKQERRRSGKKTTWVTLEKSTCHVAFNCEDDEGRIAIDGRSAEVISKHRVVETEGKYRYTEEVLKVGDALYAIGTAGIDSAHPDRLIMSNGDYFEPFILSNYPEVQVMLMKARRGMFFFNVAFAGLVLALLLGFATSGGFAVTDFLMAALAAPAYLIFMTLVLHYNDLVYLRQRALRNWSNIGVSLGKRSNLVESLQDITQRYFSHERDLQSSITLLRERLNVDLSDQAAVSDYIAEEGRTERRLLAVLEAYPDLKGNEPIELLMHTLSTLETEIAYLRQGYNDAVELYNARIASVPDVIFAFLFGFRSLDFVRGAQR